LTGLWAATQLVLPIGGALLATAIVKGQHRALRLPPELSAWRLLRTTWIAVAVAIVLVIIVMVTGVAGWLGLLVGLLVWLGFLVAFLYDMAVIRQRAGR